MPLRPGSSQAAISANISELTHNGSKKRSRKQIIAIALKKAGKSRPAMNKITAPAPSASLY